MVNLLMRRPSAQQWPGKHTDFRTWTVRWLRDGPVPAGTLGLVGHRRRWWRGGRWQITFDVTSDDGADEEDDKPREIVKVFRRLPCRDVELVHGPRSSWQYLVYRPVGHWPWVRIEPWHGDGRDYTGWTARATTGRRVPPGFGGPVVACERQGEDLVHVIDWRPYLELHVMLPHRDVELIEPPRTG